MIAFYALAAAMVVLALLFVLPPLLRLHASSAKSVLSDELNLVVLRDQLRELDADLQAGTIDALAYQSARHELEQRVAQDVQASPSKVQATLRQHWSALVVVVLVPLVAVSAYRVVGTPQGLDVTAVAPPSASKPPLAEAAAGGAVTAEQIEGMVARLAEKLKSKPDDVNGWRMLARSYETLRRFDQAADAYQQLLKLTPDDSAVMVDYAVTLAMSSGQRLSGEPERVINRALEIDPGNLQALALAGSAAFEREDYANAIKAWQQVLALMPPGSDMASSIASSLDKARARLAAKENGRNTGP
jgi:cytochrome c-type biogenesis protein CcmH